MNPLITRLTFNLGMEMGPLQVSGRAVIRAIKFPVSASLAICEEGAIVADINASPFSLNALVGPNHVPAKFVLSSVAVWMYITLRTYDWHLCLSENSMISP